ncbi:hypothetical protein B0T16DRAFT_136979 [Cercophora newfieldiana]|uniref:Secreted protein n=1 Tax=Cercophora newfieldiana TaxID=92897 RepID=A0AA39YE47_9PEZI|nr:hypothetical protein B0T16DRAFT_136979 [Cercophora newfieldiana]
MSPSSAVTVALLASTSILVAAQDTILSCADVKCPTFPQRASNDCNITSSSYSNVGVSKIPGLPSSLGGLTWVEAIAVDDSNPQRRFIKDFYLGSDPNANTEDLGSCALFFTKVSRNVVFKDSRDITSAQGTCAEAMSQECVSKLLQRAQGVDLQGLPSKEACSQLKSVFEGRMDTECASFATGAAWEGVEAKELSGPGAPSAITSSQNSSTNCWPIEPKSFNLAPVATIVTNGTNNIVAGEQDLFKITPILTVVFPSSNSSGVSRTAAQLTCMKAIDMSVAKNSTKVGDPNESAAPGRLSVGATTAALIVALITFVTQLC